MFPSAFKLSNKVLLKPETMSDKECSPLEVFTDGKQCISLWKLTWKEWFSILFFRKVWLCVHSGATQPPVWLWATKEALHETQVEVPAITKEELKTLRTSTT